MLAVSPLPAESFLFLFLLLFLVVEFNGTRHQRGFVSLLYLEVVLISACFFLFRCAAMTVRLIGARTLYGAVVIARPLPPSLQLFMGPLSMFVSKLRSAAMMSGSLVQELCMGPLSLLVLCHPPCNFLWDRCQCSCTSCEAGAAMMSGSLVQRERTLQPFFSGFL